MPIDPSLTERHRRRLVIALVAAPLLIALPALWPHVGEPEFISRHMDELLIFLVLPLVCALLLAARQKR